MTRRRRQSKTVQNWFSNTVYDTTLYTITLQMKFIDSCNIDRFIASYTNLLSIDKIHLYHLENKIVIV